MKLHFMILLIFAFSFNGIARDNHGGHEKWEYLLVDTGDILQIAIPLSAELISLYEKDYYGAKKILLSYCTNLFISYSLKYLIIKQRPEGRNKYDSFPSGHTSSAFSGASIIHTRYGWKYGLPAYILAGIVGISRMEGPDGFHDGWDVIGGAAVGIGSTYLFNKSPWKKINIGFANANNMKVLSLNYNF
jgi:membrane-associated phospholipid phosphatase